MFRAKQRRTALAVAAGFAAIVLAPTTCSGDGLAGGIWGNYAYPFSAEDPGWGEVGDGALVIYWDRVWDTGSAAWTTSAEARFGPGGFTDPKNNFTGAYATVHKAWVAWSPDDRFRLTLGKSQVPFGWKTYNFWPGDLHLAAYGDQMDLGLKLSGEAGSLGYDLAWFIADDFGSRSTDTVDDNAHWGSSRTYRKVDTAVAQFRWRPTEALSFGLAHQAGKLEDLTGASPRPTDGDHHASVAFLEYEADLWFARLSLIDADRQLPAVTGGLGPAPRSAGSRRAAFEIGRTIGRWTLYLDATAARPERVDTPGDDATGKTVTAWAPGARFDYGPGWLYIEALFQDGDFDRDGRIVEGDFEALYISADIYF